MNNVWIVTQGPEEDEIPPTMMCVHTSPMRAMHCIVARKFTDDAEVNFKYAVEEWPTDSGKACDVGGYDPLTMHY